MTNLREHSSATVDELRRFLEGMRGKSANEVLGQIAHSGLARAVVQATIVSIVGIALFTVGPYVVFGGKKKSSDDKSAAAPPNATTARTPIAPATPAATSAADNSKSSAPDAASPSGARSTGAGVGDVDLERAARQLGVGETKSADPKSNPREKDLDSLLDKVK